MPAKSTPIKGTDVTERVARLEPKLVGMRRELHKRPELSFREHRTAAAVARSLTRLGLDVRTGIGGTGVTADLKGGAPGPTILLRADMDALPITERTGLDFASTIDGAMHACGHDVHTSAMVGVATILCEMRETLAGSVRFCFQPAEEILAGAARMIAEGAMEGIDHVIGAHVDSNMPLGAVCATAGPFLAGADFFEIRIRGQAGHAAMPHLSVDPVYAACQLVTAIQSIVSRETKAGEPLVLSIGAIQGGQVANIVVEEVQLRGTLRWFSGTERARALERIEALMTGVCEGLRARGELEVTASTPVTANDPASVELLKSVILGCGRANLVNAGRLMVSDDMALLLEQAPGVYFLAGARRSGAPHHHPEFEIDEGAIGLICEILTRCALKFLGSD